MLPILPGSIATPRAPDPGPPRRCLLSVGAVRLRARALGDFAATVECARHDRPRRPSAHTLAQSDAPPLASEGWGCPERNRCSIAGSSGNNAGGPRRTVPPRTPPNLYAGNGRNLRARFG